MFMALGILIPILFHAAGLGSMFLPMFWPVAAGGFFISIPYALLTGLLTPLLSFLMTGMPPVPTLYKMMMELSALGFAVSFFSRKTRFGLFWIVLIGLLSSVGAGLAGSWVVAKLAGLPPAFYALGSVLRSAPGYGTLLILIPAAVSRIMRRPVLLTEKPNA